MTIWLALHYSLAAFIGWSSSKAFFGFLEWRDRRFWRRFYARAYGWGPPWDQ